MTWRLEGTLVELCSCEPGCDCNVRGVPNSEAGNCEAFVCYAAERGHFDTVDLAGVTFVGGPVQRDAHDPPRRSRLRLLRDLQLHLR
jgi:hypothetical protein